MAARLPPPTWTSLARAVRRRPRAAPRGVRDPRQPRGPPLPVPDADAAAPGRLRRVRRAGQGADRGRQSGDRQGAGPAGPRGSRTIRAGAGPGALPADRGRPPAARRAADPRPRRDALRDARPGRALRRRLLSRARDPPARARHGAGRSARVGYSGLDRGHAIGRAELRGLGGAPLSGRLLGRRHARVGLCPRRTAAGGAGTRRPRAAGAGARDAPRPLAARARPSRPRGADAGGRLRPAPARRGSGPVWLVRAQCRTPARRADRARARA